MANAISRQTVMHITLNKLSLQGRIKLMFLEKTITSDSATPQQSRGKPGDRWEGTTEGCPVMGIPCQPWRMGKMQTAEMVVGNSRESEQQEYMLSYVPLTVTFLPRWKTLVKMFLDPEPLRSPPRACQGKKTVTITMAPVLSWLWPVVRTTFYAGYKCTHTNENFVKQ